MLNPVKIGVLVSGSGTNLQALIDAEKSGVLKSGRIELVISSKAGVQALERAAKNGIKGETVCLRQCASRDEFEQRIISLLEENDIRLIVLAGFMCILSHRFTRCFPDRIINVHPSLIPSFCGEGFYGLRVHEAALEYGVKVTGATVHYVNEITDGGRIIMQKPVEVRDDDTPQLLQRRVMEQAEWIILPRATEEVCQKILKETEIEA